MLYWFVVLVVLSFVLTPSLWQLAVRKNEKVKGKTQSNRGLIAWQIAKVFVALAFSYWLGYLRLLDHNVSAVLTNVTFVYSITLVLDIVILYSLRPNQGNKTIKPLTIFGVLVFLTWIFMTTIYPLSIKGDLYQLVDAEVKEDKMQATDIEHIPSVPIESASYKAEKLIGSLTNSSYYKLGDLTRQKIGNEEFWVAPVEYAGFFQSRKAGSIPAYIKVSAERKDDTGTLVQKVADEKIEMKYVPSGYFSHYLYRLIRNEYPKDIIIGSGFEPDDNGKPYYVVAVGHYDKFRSGTVADAAVIIDPQTGEMKRYALEEVPAYVDFVIPPNMASSYNEWQAKYKHGWWNTLFGKQDITDVTLWNTGEEVIGVFGPDNHMYWFTDHTSPGTNSLKGYTLMDGRTGKLTFYKGANGFANGKAALDAVHNSYKKEQWTGTNPILYNIYGSETWYVPVVDSNGLLRNIALVNAQNPQIVATGESKQEALNSYKFMLATEGSGDSTSPTNSSEVVEIQGTVLRVGTVQIGENTVVQVLLDNSEKIFNVNPKESTYATFIREGDLLKLSYVDTKEVMVSVEKVYNETIKR